MNALRHTHELVVPGGTLVDLHPITESSVRANGRKIGVIEEPEWVSVTLPNAEARLDEAIRDGYYVLEAEIEFDLREHFDSIEELVEARRAYVELQDDLVERIRDAGPPIVTTEHCVGRRLRVL